MELQYLTHLVIIIVKYLPYKLLWSGLQILTNYYSLIFQINPYALFLK